jgi:hypothetical protein
MLTEYLYRSCTILQYLIFDCFKLDCIQNVALCNIMVLLTRFILVNDNLSPCSIS